MAIIVAVRLDDHLMRKAIRGHHRWPSSSLCVSTTTRRAAVITGSNHYCLDDHRTWASLQREYWPVRIREGIFTAPSRHSEAVFTLHTWSTRVQSVSLSPTSTSSSAPSVSILRSEIATSCEMPRDASTAERLSTSTSTISLDLARSRSTSTIEATSAERCARDGAKATRRSASLRSGWNVELPGRWG